MEFLFCPIMTDVQLTKQKKAADIHNCEIFHFSSAYYLLITNHAKPCGCCLYLPRHNITTIQWFSQFSGFNATQLGYRLGHGSIWCVLSLMGFCVSHLRLPCNAGSRCRAGRGSRVHSSKEAPGLHTSPGGEMGEGSLISLPIKGEKGRSTEESKRQRSEN